MRPLPHRWIAVALACCCLLSGAGRAQRHLSPLAGKTVAYFSLEMASPSMQGQRTGGLGVLAMDLPVGMGRELTRVGGQVWGVTLLYRKPWTQRIRHGRQEIGSDGSVDFQSLVSRGVLQRATDAQGRPLELNIEIPGESEHAQPRRVQVQAFVERIGATRMLRLYVPGVSEMLYNGDSWMRFRQEVALGRAGLEALARMGVRPDILHGNESHTGFVMAMADADRRFKDTARVFTTHTPVEAGLERFPLKWFRHLKLPRRYERVFKRNGRMDLTHGSMGLAAVVNAVSKEHAEVAKRMFPEHAARIVAVTNGVDPGYWQHDAIRSVARRNLRGRELQNDLWQAKQQLRRNLKREVAARTGRELNLDEPILAFTRRVTQYKDTYPMLKKHIYDICKDRSQGGLGMQVVVAGVAHPRDGTGQHWIKRFNEWMNDPRLKGRFVFVPNYLGPKTDLDLDRIAVQGADFWLSSPRKGLEACGTSDRRSVLNLGIQIWTPDTGGGREYLRQFNPGTGKGNGFYITPHSPDGLFAQLRSGTDLFYRFTKGRDGTYLRLLENVFHTIPKVSIDANVRRQIARSYVPALVGRHIGGVRLLDPARSQIRFDGARQVTTEVDIGRLQPAEVKAEIWWGQPGKEWRARRMQLVSAANGKATFAGKLEPMEPGTFVYTTRVSPRLGVNHRWAGQAGGDRVLEVDRAGHDPRLALRRWAEQHRRRSLPGVSSGEVADLVRVSGGDVTRLISLLGSYSPRARRQASLDSLARRLTYTPKVWSFVEGQKRHGVQLRPFEPLVIRNASAFTVLSGVKGRDPDITVSSVRLGGEHVAVIRPGRGERWMTFKWHSPGRETAYEGRDYTLQVQGNTWRPLSRGRR